MADLRNRTSSLKVVNLLYTAFPDFTNFKDKDDLSEFADLCALMWDDLDPQLVQTVALQWIRSEKKMPAVADIANAVLALCHKAEGELDAAEAWQIMGRSIGLTGRGGGEWLVDKATLHPLVVQSAEAYGLARFANRLDESQATDFAQFRGIFEGRVRRADEQRQMLPGTNQVLKQLTARMGSLEGRNNHLQLEAPAALPADRTVPPVLGSGPRKGLKTRKQLDAMARAGRMRVALEQKDKRIAEVSESFEDTASTLLTQLQAEREKLIEAIALADKEAGEVGPAAPIAMQARGEEHHVNSDVRQRYDGQWPDSSDQGDVGERIPDRRPIEAPAGGRR